MYNLIKTVAVETLLQLSMLFCCLRSILVIGALQCVFQRFIAKIYVKYVDLKLNCRNVIKPCYPMFIYLKTSR